MQITDLDFERDDGGIEKLGFQDFLAWLKDVKKNQNFVYWVMLFIALTVIVSVCNVILSKRIKRILLEKLNILRIFNKIMNNFLQPAENLTSSIIKFKVGDKRQCYDIIDNNVTVYGSVGEHDHGSSKVKLKSIVDYIWEVKDYPGHLIAIHLDGDYIAYAIKINNKSSGMVRVASGKSGQRALIKGMSGEVLDLQFAHLKNEHILACIDAKTLHIHKIDKLAENLICNLLLRIDDPIKNHVPKFDKVSWCPYVHSTVSDEENDDVVDVSQLIVWSRGGTFQCFNVNTIIASNGIGEHEPDNLNIGYLKWEDSNLIITWILLSPDGSTLGVSSDDGYIRFYQMYFHEKEPRCLHEWKPHNGKVVSSFFFLDNLLNLLTDDYWKFALTGAERNTEFKIWDCGTWTCLQTVSFAQSVNKKTSFIAELDRSSSYLVLTNRETRGLYVLQIIKQNEIKDEDETDDLGTNDNQSSDNDKILAVGDSNNDSTNAGGKKVYTFAFIKSVSEFPLSSPILSFCINDAAVRKYKCALNDIYLIDELDDYDEENSALFCVVIRMFIVQPKSVQECHVLYQPTLTEEQSDLKSSISNESLEGFEDYLTDISGSSAKTNQTSSSSSCTQDKNTVNEKTNLLLEKKQSVSPTAIVNASSTKVLEKSTKQSSVSPILQPTSVTSNIKNTSSSQLNLMVPDAFTATGSGGASNIEKNPAECVNSNVLSTLLMLASVTSSNAANKPENVNLLNLVNNKVIEDQEKRKIKQQKKSFSLVENLQQQQEVNTDQILASGGSSPSREVQEIMAHSCKTFFNEDSKQKEEFSQHHASENLINLDNGVEKTKLSSTTNWPKVPNVRNVIKHSTELQNSSNLISSTSLEINDLSLKMNRLIDLVQMQTLQINVLKNEIVELKKTKTDTQLAANTITTETNKNNSPSVMEKSVLKLLEEYLIRYETEHKQKIETIIAAKDAQSRNMRDEILHYFNKFMFNEFIEKITSVLVTEIQQNVVPVIIDKLDVVKKQIQIDVSQKLTTTDTILRENIAQVCKSKSIIDAFGNSVLLGVKSGLQSTYIESMSSTLIPAYEKSSQEMFKQLHDTFSRGIKEVMKQFETYLMQLEPVEACTDEILTRLTDFKKQFDQHLLKNRNSSDISTEIKRDIKAIENNMMRNLSEIIQNEIRKCFESQAASLEDSVLSVVRSQAHTPAPIVYDVQDQIKLLLCQGQVNKAFHQALIANDLSLVEYTLEKADYKSVFNPCVLEQTVLLSLIQQISADMNNHNDIKQRYLSDAILNLNLSDPITQEHAPKVLRELYKNCQCFLSNYPKNSLCSNIKMIMMAVQGMGYKIF